MKTRPVLLLLRGRAALALLVLAGLSGCGRNPAREVVAYIAQDQVFAEPLLAEFTRQTGIRVRTVFDSEAVKTVGLANRLLAERARPQADVFWGNEELRTRQLAARGLWCETHGWAAFGHRSRRIIVNTNQVALSGTAPGRLPAPTRLLELTNAVWRGRVALAYPLFGTTATHFLALRQHWGAERWEAWCRALAANQPLVVDGNSVVAKLVAKGEAWVGLTDSDDLRAVQRDGAPVAALPWNDETLLIPNTVAVVRDAPHPEAAEALFAWLQRPEVAARLVAAGALEGIETAPAAVSTLTPDWSRLVAEVEAVTDQLKTIFLR